MTKQRPTGERMTEEERLRQRPVRTDLSVFVDPDHLVKTRHWCYYCLYNDHGWCRPFRQPVHQPVSLWEADLQRKCRRSRVRSLPSFRQRGTYHSRPMPLNYDEHEDNPSWRYETIELDLY